MAAVGVASFFAHCSLACGRSQVLAKAVVVSEVTVVTAPSGAGTQLLPSTDAPVKVTTLSTC